MFLMKVIQKIRFALVIENEIFYINGSETLPPPLTREEEQPYYGEYCKRRQ